MQDSAALLYDFWYVAAPSSALARGGTVAKRLLGQSILLGRDGEGRAFALRDFCPHRGMPLRHGRFDGTTIECCYHGWCFDTGGACTAIPSLSPQETVDITRIKVQAYACRETEGLIWVYVPAPKTRLPDPLPVLPAIAGGLTFEPVESVVFPCHVDHAVVGLMDPSHGPYVHRSWWWRTKRSMHLKEKRFAPVGKGFRMLSHAPSSNSRAYRILGSGGRTTEITFELPGLRAEHIRLGNGKRIVLLTTLTPLDGERTELHQFIATDIGWVRALLPLLKPFGRAFIRQDLEIVRKQQEGLRNHDASLLLLGDADQQALWYYKLKRDWLKRDPGDNAPFENRVPEKTLRWRS